MDINVFYLDLPCKIKEFVVENSDCSYTVVLNARMSETIQKIAYEHAIKHIENDDFNKEIAATLLEGKYI